MQQQNQRAVGNDEPVMIAWKAYQQTDDYANTLSWAGKHCVGELWAAFSQGFFAAASGIETEGHDGETRHGAEHESPAPKGDAQ